MIKEVYQNVELMTMRPIMNHKVINLLKEVIKIEKCKLIRKTYNINFFMLKG